MHTCAIWHGRLYLRGTVAGRVERALGESQLIIHAGTSKTGTTSIQGFLHRNSELLAKRGFHFLVTGRKHIAHTPIHRALRSPEAPILWKSIEDEMSEGGEGTYILSSEYFFSKSAADGFAEHMPRNLRDRTRVLVYVRRQDKYAESLYKQHVKVGRILPDPVTHYERSKNSYRYLDELSAHASVFGDDAIQVRPFEGSKLVGGDVIEDLIAALGIREAEGLDRETDASNRSLSREAMEVVGAIARNTGMNARQIMREMQRSGDTKLMRSGDVFDMSTRKDMMAFYAQSNAEIQKRFRPASDDELFDLSDLADIGGVPATDPVERLDRTNHAYEAALQAMERIRRSKKLRLYK